MTYIFTRKGRKGETQIRINVDGNPLDKSLYGKAFQEHLSFGRYNLSFDR